MRTAATLSVSVLHGLDTMTPAIGIGHIDTILSVC
jgi:hypothetical protein